MFLHTGTLYCQEVHRYKFDVNQIPGSLDFGTHTIISAHLRLWGNNQCNFHMGCYKCMVLIHSRGCNYSAHAAVELIMVFPSPFIHKVFT